MKKERRQIWLIGIFLLAGCVFGYFVAVTQENQLQDPAYIAFFTFPIYTCIGIVCSIPFMIYLTVILARGKRR